MSRGVSSFSVFRLSSQPGYLALPFCGEIPVTFWYVSQILERPRRRPERSASRDGFRGPQFLRSQVFVTESCCWLTGPFKIAKNAHNTRFLRLARLGSAGRGVVLGRRNVGLSRPGSPFVSSAQPVG